MGKISINRIGNELNVKGTPRRNLVWKRVSPGKGREDGEPIAMLAEVPVLGGIAELAYHRSLKPDAKGSRKILQVDVSWQPHGSGGQVHIASIGGGKSIVNRAKKRFAKWALEEHGLEFVLRPTNSGPIWTLISVNGQTAAEEQGAEKDPVTEPEAIGGLDVQPPVAETGDGNGHVSLLAERISYARSEANKQDNDWRLTCLSFRNGLLKIPPKAIAAADDELLALLIEFDTKVGTLLGQE